MLGRGKQRLVHSDFGHQVISRQALNAGNALPQRDGLLKRDHVPVDLFFDTPDARSQRPPIFQEFLQQKAVMIAHPALNRQTQLRNLFP